MVKRNNIYSLNFILGDSSPLTKISCAHFFYLSNAFFSCLDAQHYLLDYSPLKLKILDLSSQDGACLPWSKCLEQIHELNSVEVLKPEVYL